MKRVNQAPPGLSLPRVGHELGDDDPLDPLYGGSDLPELELVRPPKDSVRTRRPDASDHDPLDPLAPVGGMPQLDVVMPEKRSGRDSGRRSRPSIPAESGRHSISVRSDSPEELAKRRKRKNEARRKAEIQAVAKYGSPPSNPFTAVPYAVAVFFRRMELQRRERELHTQSEATKKAAHAALGKLARKLLRTERAELEDAGLLQKMREAERALRGIPVADDAAAAHHEAQADRDALDQKIRDAEAHAAPWRDREAKLRAEAETLQFELKRRRGALQRVEIELRSAPQRRPELEPALRARQQEVRAQEAVVAEKVDALTTAREHLAQHMEAVARAQDARRHLERELSGTSSVEMTIGVSVSKQDETISSFAMAARKRGLADALAENRVATRAVDEANRVKRELRLVRAALSAYDKRGLAMGATVIALILVAVALIITIRAIA